MTSAAQPQAARPAISRKKPIPLQIKRLKGRDARDTVETPSYSTSVGRGNNRAKDWQMISVEYDTFPEWIDELAVHFYVISMEKDKETRQIVYSYYETLVRYVDIQRDRGHLARAFLRPTALERYGEVVGVAVEMSVDGELVALESDEIKKAGLPEKWWKNPKVLDSKSVTTRKGYLLDREKSPWAFINIDDYEVIK
ncbi:hypothetical protein H8D64_01580 [PVC group bacterium]|nr:hypothetical protein [PVC group bacterium]